jgi:hypothetical protein
MDAVFSEEANETAYGEKRPRLVAWLQEHNAHGLSYSPALWMPEGDKPETGEWIRAYWLDQPRSYEPVTPEKALTPEQIVAEQVWHFLLQSDEVAEAIRIELESDDLDGARLQEQIADKVLTQFKLEGRRIPW